MTYLLLSTAFLVIAVIVAVVVGRGIPRPRFAALSVAALVLLALTAVFDTVMIAAGLFTYPDDRVSGVRIGRAPIEDLAYPLAAVILLPALWARARSRHDR